MQKFREKYHENETKALKKELDNIINKPLLTPDEIWKIKETTFYKWRQKYDYPRILKHFNEKLKGFEDWKKEYKITDNFLMKYGISNCIKPGFYKDKKKYVVEKIWDDKKSEFISFQNIDKKYYKLGPYQVSHKVTKIFIGYLDWCKKRKLEFLPKQKNIYRFINKYIKSNIHSKELEVEILDGLNLLKIGGINISANLWGMINTKYFEFVNAEYITIEGDLATGGRPLVFDYSYLDNLQCTNLDLALVEIRNSSLLDCDIRNSNIQQWDFILSKVTGKIINSDFRMNNIYGGLFNVDFKNSTVSSLDINTSTTNEFSFENTYRVFKQLFANQGEDTTAVKYFLREMKIKRLKTLKNIIKPAIRRSLFNPNWLTLFVLKTLTSIKSLFSYLFQKINHLYWGYGRQPCKILINSLILIVLFSIIFYFNRSYIITTPPISIKDYLYFSTTTFLTFGIADFEPLGNLKIWVLLEALCGALSLVFFVAGFEKNKY
jgi:hypothetical protein